MRYVEPYIIFPRKLKSGSVIYYYQYRDETGRRSAMYSTGCKNLAKAKKYVHDLYNQNMFQTSSNMNFGTFAKNFFSPDSEYCKWREIGNSKIKPETLRRYNTSLDYQILPFFERMKMNAITTATIKEWIIWCSDKWSAKTINNAQGVLNIIFDNAVEKKIIRTNPISKQIKYGKIQKKERDLLTVEEIKMIYQSDWKNEMQKKGFLVAVLTGMREGEICALDDCHIFDNYFFVEFSLNERYGIGSTKTNVSRYVPIPEGLNLITDSKFAFYSHSDKNEPMKPHCLYNAFIRKCKSMGIDTKERGITFHSLRNFFISYLQGESIPLQKIKAVVGHADDCMTEWYTYWKPEMFQEVYQAQKKLFELITR